MEHTQDQDRERSYTPGSMVLLTRLAKQVYRRSSDELLGMHLRHLMTLSYLRDHDDAPQQELAEAFCMDANNVVLLLNELEDRGHIARRRDPTDRRRHRVELTPAGRRALIGAERAQESIEDEVLGALDPDERATLWRLLTRALYGSESASESSSPADEQGLAAAR
ncbi:MAG TPA: MarR family winged helix-turn-helix transcriptional regulator [Solirubrobacteraceae bacterium]|jgi:DNA-binding MarR family transcriptional regulator|nr:MarR family winged helix-turn-helix transcriptional regulator [Solirubrobacteraceae bacterium]